MMYVASLITILLLSIAAGGFAYWFFEIHRKSATPATTTTTKEKFLSVSAAVHCAQRCSGYPRNSDAKHACWKACKHAWYRANCKCSNDPMTMKHDIAMY